MGLWSYASGASRIALFTSLALLKSARRAGYHTLRALNQHKAGTAGHAKLLGFNRKRQSQVAILCTFEVNVVLERSSPRTGIHALVVRQKGVFRAGCAATQVGARQTSWKTSNTGGVGQKRLLGTRIVATALKKQSGGRTLGQTSLLVLFCILRTGFLAN